MVRDMWNTTALGVALALAGVGCSSAPKYNEPYAQAAKPAQASWTDTFTAPFKSSPKKADPTELANDPTSLKTPNPKPTASLFVASANLFEKSNNAQAAAAEYEKALKLDPMFQPALLGYARLLDCQGDFSGATNYYRRAIAAHPADPTPHNDLGICLARQGSLEAAASEISKAVSLQPDKALYRNNLAQVQMEQGRVNDAFFSLRAAKGDAVAHYNLAYMLHEKGDLDSAREHATLALRVDPNLSAANDLLAQLNSGGARSADISRISLPSHTTPVHGSTSTLPTLPASYAPKNSAAVAASGDFVESGPSGWNSNATAANPVYPSTVSDSHVSPIQSEYVPSQSVLPNDPPLPPLPDQIGS